MRIVCISDTHGMHERIELPRGDVLLHAGDFSTRSRSADVRVFLEWFADQPHPHKVLIAGNHDFLFERQSELARSLVPDRVTYLQDSGAVIAGVRFWGSPWQPWFFWWAFNLRRGRPLREKWNLIPADTEVLVTHGPPHGTADEVGRGRHVGCEELAIAVSRVQPLLHVFGHIHEGYGRLGDSVNASICTVSYEPTNAPIVVDLEVPRRPTGTSADS